MVGALITFIIYLVVVGLILWLLSYLVDVLPLEPPFKQVAKVAILVVGVLIIILLLLGLLGMVDVGIRPIVRLP